MPVCEGAGEGAPCRGWCCFLVIQHRRQQRASPHLVPVACPSKLAHTLWPPLTLLQLRNRKNGTAMRRVFVHGVFRKPSGAPATAA